MAGVVGGSMYVVYTVAAEKAGGSASFTMWVRGRQPVGRRYQMELEFTGACAACRSHFLRELGKRQPGGLHCLMGVEERHLRR